MDTKSQRAFELEREITAFQRKEILLLQAERYEEWLDLLTEDVLYWMPMVVNSMRRQNLERGRSDQGYYDDNLDSLRLRIKKLGSTMAWSEDPKSRRRYFVQLMDIQPDASDENEVDVVSNILVYQSRGESQENYFVGGREDRLRKVGGEWKIASRKVVIERTIIAERFLDTLF